MLGRLLGVNLGAGRLCSPKSLPSAPPVPPHSPVPTLLPSPSLPQGPAAGAAGTPSPLGTGAPPWDVFLAPTRHFWQQHRGWGGQTSLGRACGGGAGALVGRAGTWCAPGCVPGATWVPGVGAVVSLPWHSDRSRGAHGPPALLPDVVSGGFASPPSLPLCPGDVFQAQIGKRGGPERRPFQLPLAAAPAAPWLPQPSRSLLPPPCSLFALEGPRWVPPCPKTTPRWLGQSIPQRGCPWKRRDPKAAVRGEASLGSCLSSHPWHWAPRMRPRRPAPPGPNFSSFFTLPWPCGASVPPLSIPTGSGQAAASGAVRGFPRPRPRGFLLGVLQLLRGGCSRERREHRLPLSGAEPFLPRR